MRAKEAMRQPNVIYGHAECAHPQFAAGDLKVLATKTGLQLRPDADRAALARALESAFHFFIAGYRGGAVAPPGERAKWARELQRRANNLLAMFEMEDASADRVLNARWLLQDLVIDSVAEAGLPLDMAQGIDEALRAVGVLAHRAGIAAAAFEARKGARRQPRWQEVDLFAALRVVFREAFGKEWAPGTDPSTGRRGGPGLRFGTAVIHMIGERLAEDDPLQATLRRLAEPETVTERVRGTRLSGGLVRKRKAKRHRDRPRAAT